VVFLDLLMSGVSGYDVIASMRADPVLAPIPIVVVSAQDVPGESLVAQELTLARVNGIPFREALRWIKEGLDRPLTESSVREPLGEPPG
jgi:CheY-like chemotaxis protein